MGNKMQKASSSQELRDKSPKPSINTARKVEGLDKEKPHSPGDGIRSMQTSGVFRALNFELYARPSKPIMIFGAVAFSLCVGYITYMRYTHRYNKDEMYEALTEDGTVVLRPRKSRWES